MPMNKQSKRNEEVFGVISHLFAEKGYLETMMREIAQKLGMKPASLYNYFASKEEALFKLLKESVANAIKKILAR